MTKDHASAINDTQSFHSVYRYSEEYAYGVPLFYLISNGSIVWSEAGWWGNDYGSKSEIWMYGNITHYLFELTGTQIDLEYTFEEQTSVTPLTDIGFEESNIIDIPTSTTNFSFWWSLIAIPVYTGRRKR